MTRAELETLSVGEQSKWLRDAGWEIDNLGRSLVWKLKNKSGTTTTTFPGACEMQLRRDAQKLGIERQVQKRFNYNLEQFDPMSDAVESTGDDLVIEDKLLKQIKDSGEWLGDNLLRLAFRAGVAWGRFQKTSDLK